MNYKLLIQLTVIVVLLVVNTVSAKSSVGTPVNELNLSLYDLKIVRYLNESYPGEEIRILSRDKYTNPETGTTYTILVAYHDDKPIQLTLNQKNNRVGGMNQIKDDWKAYISALPEPYQKMSKNLRKNIRRKYNGSLPGLNEKYNSSITFPVLFIANDTHDLIKIALKVDSVTGFPDVFNGKYVKYVKSTLTLPTIFEVINSTPVANTWLDGKFLLYLNDSVPGVNGNYFPNNLSLNGSRATVAVLDSGVNYSHPALNIDPGDVNDFTDMLGDGYTWNGNDTNGHGTHVAGIIGSTNETFRGMAYGSKIVSGKVYAGGRKSSWMSTVIEAINWAYDDQSADVIQMSFGYPVDFCLGSPFYYITDSDGSSKLTVYIDYMTYTHANLTFVISAGQYETEAPQDCNEDGNISAPADAYNGISVGAASDDLTQVEVFSAHAPTADGRYKIDVTAPGVNIYSPNASYSTTEDFTTFSGTSAAAPFVSGLAALLVDYAEKEGKEYNSLLIKAAIMNSAKKINDRGGNLWYHTNSEPLDTDSGAGLIDAKKAYEIFSNESKLFQDYILNGSTRVYSVNLTSATNLTITLVWLRHVSSPSDDDVLANNLNLFLYNESGSLIATSTSTLDNVEHIYKEVTTPGLYKIKVYAVDITEGYYETYALAYDYKAAAIYSKPLIAGWNLISLPLNMDE